MRIKQYIWALAGCAMALFSLLAGSGIGQTYGLYGKAAIVIGALYLLMPVLKAVIGNEVRKKDLIVFLLLFWTVCIWPIFSGHGFRGFEYAWLMVLPYVMGQFPMKRQDIRWLAIAVGGTGMAVVLARTYTSMFDGWNPNDIAIMGFFSAAVFFSAPWESKWARRIEKLFLLGMVLLIWQLDSRSCLIGTGCLLVLSFGIVKPKSLAVSKGWRRLLLLTPLIVSVGVVVLRDLSLFDSLNTWSLQTFGKNIFNGRDAVWEEGLQSLHDRFLFGSGYINNGYWHNAAISALTAFGTVGYGAWIYYFENILNRARTWRGDATMCRCAAALLIIMLQQSFELGLISTSGSMLPYVILGLMLGRVRYLKEKEA